MRFSPSATLSFKKMPCTNESSSRRRPDGTLRKSQHECCETDLRHAILLARGNMVGTKGDVAGTLQTYIDETTQTAHVTAWKCDLLHNPHANPYFTPTNFFAHRGDGNPINRAISKTDLVWIVIEGLVQEIDPALKIGYTLSSENGTLLYWSYHTDTAEAQRPSIQRGIVRSKPTPSLSKRGHISPGTHWKPPLPQLAF